jgi:hypothetical protein
VWDKNGNKTIVKRTEEEFKAAQTAKLKETLLWDEFSLARKATVPSACGTDACRGIDFIANDICLLPRVYSGLINLNNRQVLE